MYDNASGDVLHQRGDDVTVGWDCGYYFDVTLPGLLVVTFYVWGTVVNGLAAGWDPTKYTDQYRENLMRVIQAKLKGKKVDLEAEEEPRQAEVVDLMERLRRSLAQTGKAPKARAAKAQRTTRSPRKRAKHAA